MANIDKNSKEVTTKASKQMKDPKSTQHQNSIAGKVPDKLGQALKLFETCEWSTYQLSPVIFYS